MKDDKNINTELSKAFFARERRDMERGAWGRKIFTVPISLFIIGVIALGGYTLLRNKHISLNITINVGNTPSPAPAGENTETAVEDTTEPLRLYDFENGLQSWEIPLWATEKHDHVALSIGKAPFGKGDDSLRSLKVDTDFPGDSWTAALVEVQQYLDLTGSDSISCYLYLPQYAPEGLRCRLILTVGEDWDFVEMSRSVSLRPGEWTEVKADISPGSRDWRRRIVDNAFVTDVRKIAVRVESDHIPYKGAFCLDKVTAVSRQIERR